MAVLGTIYYPEGTDAENCNYSITYSEDSAQQTTITVVSSIDNVKAGVTVEIPSSINLNGVRSVTEIASDAAKNKIQVSNISLIIPNSIMSIGTGAFSGCSGLVAVHYIGSMAEWCFINFLSVSSCPLNNHGDTILFYTNDKEDTYFDDEHDELIITDQFDQLALQKRNFNALAFGTYFRRKIKKIVYENPSQHSSDFQIIGVRSIINASQDDGYQKDKEDSFPPHKILIYKNRVLFGVNFCNLDDLKETMVDTIGPGAFFAAFEYTHKHPNFEGKNYYFNQFLPDTIKYIEHDALSSNNNFHLSLSKNLEYLQSDGQINRTISGAIYLTDENNSNFEYYYNYDKNNDNLTPIILSNHGNVTVPAEYAIKPGTRVIAAYSFDAKYRPLESIIIPDSVIQIGANCFRYCYARSFDNTHLYKEGEIAKQNDKIYECILDCPSINLVPDENPLYWQERDQIYLKINNGYENIEGYKRNTHLSNIVRIGNYAFYNCNLDNYDHTLIFSSGISFIDHSAFSSSDALNQIKHIYFEPMSKCEKIGDTVFYNMPCLETANLPYYLKSLGYRAFSGSSIKNIIIPAGVEEISSHTFHRCLQLETITFNNTIIPEYCCETCSALKEVIIKGKITKIEKGAFNGCGQLAKLRLPNSINYIGNSINSISAASTNKGIQDIYYDGWEKDWNTKVEKASGWNSGHTGSNIWRLHFWTGMIYSFTL